MNIEETNSQKHSINCQGKLLDLSEPKVMAIVNITPDSFYEGSRYTTPDEIRQRIYDVINLGADIIDIGAYSSRPGAEHITENEEWNRLVVALEIVRKEFDDVIVSVDTFRSDIARKVVSVFNVDIINDISAGEMDAKMFEAIAELSVPFIMMHMQGTPQSMQQNPEYKHLIKDIFNFFSKKINQLRLLGVNDIILDPGFGFGKTLDHNFQLMKYLSDFEIFELPILVGVSRKSMIYKFLDIDPQDGLNGTTVLHTCALMSGASILRVHDVQEAKETISLYQKIKGSHIDYWHE